MSFMKTLATLAIGIAATKGYQRFKQGGGLKGMEDALSNVGAPGGMADQAAEMAKKMGVPVDSAVVKDMVAKMGAGAAQATAAGEAGLGNLMGALAGTAAAGSDMFKNVMGTLTGGKLDGASEENAKLMIKAMIMAAKADGTIDDEERAKIMGHLKDATPDELAFVKAELDAPIDITSFAAEVGVSARSQVYATSLLAITADSDVEKAYLRQLATALGLSDADRDAAHVAMGLPPLG